MPTKKKRINVSLSKKIYVFLQGIALRDEMPVASKAADLIEKALEDEEDAYFSALGDKRASENVVYISHEEAWK